MNKSGGGTLVLATDNDYSGLTTVTGGTLQFNTAGAMGTSPITLNGGVLSNGTGANTTLTNSVSVGATGGTLDTGTAGLTMATLGTVGGVLTKTGAGDLTFTGTVSPGSAGGFNVAQGNIVLNQALNAVTDLGAASTLTGNLVLTNAMRLNVNTSLTGTGKILVPTSGTTISKNSSANATYAVPIVLNQGGAFTPGSWSGTTYTGGSFSTMVFGNSAAGAVILDTGTTITGDSELDLTSSSSGGSTGGLTINVPLAYTGNTTVNSGTASKITLGVDNALPTTTGVIAGTKTNFSTPTLDLNGHNQTVAYLADGSLASGVKFLTIANTLAGSTSTLTVGSSTTPGTAKFTGVLADGNATSKLNLVKSGSNTLTLGRASTYTGTTTVSGTGSLVLAQSGSLSTGTAVSVGTGATFATAYTSAANTITGGSTLSLAAGSFLNLADGFDNTLNFLSDGSSLAGGTLTFDFTTSAWDKIAFGAAAFSGTNTIAFSGTPTFAVGNYTLMTGTAFSGTGTFSTTATASGLNLAVVQVGNEVQLQVTTAGGSGNNTQLTTASSGSFGRILVNSTPSLSTLTFAKTGSDTTGFSVTSPAGITVAPSSGSLAAGPVPTTGLTATLQANANGTGVAGSKSYNLTLANTATDSAGAGLGSADANDTITVTADVVNQRSFTGGSAIALGRYLIGGSPTGSTTISSAGLHAVTGDATLTGFSPISGYTLTTTTGANVFAGTTATQDAVYTIGGTPSAVGLISGTFTSPVTAELGTISNVNVGFTANPVNQRVLTVNTPTVAVGRYLIGTSPTGTTTTSITSLGTNDTTANATIGTFTSVGGLTLTASNSTAFTGAATQTANYAILGNADRGLDQRLGHRAGDRRIRHDRLAQRNDHRQPGESTRDSRRPASRWVDSWSTPRRPPRRPSPATAFTIRPPTPR
ncbi:MAG: autotransporter-associated beta strand repeat-containing protein [Pirellulales bacterium]